MARKRELPKTPRRGSAAGAGKAVIYARYSSHAQKDASIEQQVEWCTAFAKERGLTIINVYADRAVSGRSDRRENFQQMMKDAAKGQFSFVVAWKSNRMGRNMMEAMLNDARLQDYGVRTIYVEEDFDDTAAGRFALRNMMNVNQFYSENMSEDIKRGMYDNAMQCKITNGTLPLGFKKGKDLHYEIDPPKAEIVREIFSRVLRGDPFADIASDLNARGIKTSAGNRWGKSSFQNMLRNERYTGVYIYGDIRVDGGIPQIIDKGTFERVQEVLKTKKNPQGRHRTNGDYLLTGKLFCGLCKAPMVGMSGKSKTGALHRYYICQRKRAGEDCEKKIVRKDEIEYAVVKAVQDYILRDDVLEYVTNSAMRFSIEYRQQSGIGAIEEKLKENKKLIQNVMSAIEQGIITNTTKARLLELEKEQAVLSSRLAEENASMLSYSEDDIRSYFSLYRNGNIKNKSVQAAMIDNFIRAVYLFDDHIEIWFEMTGEKNTVDAELGTFVIDDIDLAEASTSSFKLPPSPPSYPYKNDIGSEKPRSSAVFSFFRGPKWRVTP